ncbi:MAG: MarR family transcriptional regulator [Cytophagales bacterium]|nr:MarR family transcriptional regulator [Cytophagales bacterium]
MERSEVQMTDAEFDILDELYFVISFQDLLEQLDMDKTELSKHLKKFYSRGWLRFFSSPDGTADVEEVSVESLSNSYLLASKAGLKAHNS